MVATDLLGRPGSIRQWNETRNVVFTSALFLLTTGVRSPTQAEDFSSSLCVQTGSEAHPASCPMDTRSPFPGSKARPGRNSDRSPPSNAEIDNEELYLLSPQTPPWRVAGQLYLYTFYFLLDFNTLDLRGMKWQEAGENCIMRSCMVCTLHPVLLEWSKQEGWDGQDMWCAWGGEVCIQHFGWEAWREETTRTT
jgi:hypothetical protein